MKNLMLENLSSRESDLKKGIRIDKKIKGNEGVVSNFLHNLIIFEVIGGWVG